MNDTWIHHRAFGVTARRFPLRALACAVFALGLGGVSCAPVSVAPDIETQISFLNLSRTEYVTFGVRAHGSDGAFSYSPLLAPGATTRTRFADLLGTRCPGSIDLQVLSYARVNADLPIGLDGGESVQTTPTVAGELDDVPVCALETLETYTVVNWDAPAGIARVKIAQCSAIDASLSAGGRLGASGAWEVAGVDARLSVTVTPSHAANSPISGRVATSEGAGVEGVVVLLRTRYRSALDCAAPDDAAVSGYSEPITYAITDAQGRFQIDRPAGVYRLEFYSDTVAFRPGVLDVETPREEISVLAEAL